MQVIYKSIHKSIWEAIEQAERNRRTIEKIILLTSEWKELNDYIKTLDRHHCSDDNRKITKYMGVTIEVTNG